MYTELTNKILDKWGIYWEDLVYTSNTKELSYGDLVCTLLEHRSIKASAEYLGISTRTLERVIPTTLGKYCDKDSTHTAPWSVSLLAQIDIRKCYKCKKYLVKSEDFYSNVGCPCRACDSFNRKNTRLLDPQKYRDKSKAHYEANKHYYILKSSNRKSQILQAIPSWANLMEIETIYNNCPKGSHVDHIVPLNGTLVCGLHVENNLQYLSAEENLRKSNSFTN